VKFKSLFEKVYPGYYARLIKSYPLLTAGEQRLFLLLKLGYESKQIAGMLAISTESIRKSKYRLKKKLNLNESDDLEQMIKNF
jgi:DNA-binding CsgD family transcriptional regulator